MKTFGCFGWCWLLLYVLIRLIRMPKILRMQSIYMLWFPCIALSLG